jgi:XTP/dITP diphosphohydrolase|tara:strand:- start:11072 stop:11653 length:582 start_codon:yes stop_codon:yes gene_type:complete
MELVFASHNENKVNEVRKILPNNFTIISLNDLNFYEEIPENKNTIEGNSTFKANFIYKKFKLNVFADDTGLEITALNDLPGIKSARYAGPEKDSKKNLNKVLNDLKGIDLRNARFKTVISLIYSGKLNLFEGIIYGEITRHKIGNGGFGYDTIFKPENYSKTFGEMSSKQKNKISHRAIAINKLKNFLRKVYD